MPPSSPDASSQPPPPPLSTRRRLILQQLTRRTDHYPSNYADNHSLPADNSTLQAAQTQAAELRALHSAVLNGLHHGANHLQGLINNTINDIHSVRSERGKPKKSNNSREAPLSPASSTADCAIRPAHEYPVFMPSHEDFLLSKEVVSNRRSSVDNCDSLREERLNYILDHDNKRSFSEISKSARISSLHESLNLPSRGADSHYHSLNLQQGSLNYSLEARPNQWITSIHPIKPSEGASIKGSNHHAKIKIKDGGVKVLSDYTARQKALSEFLNEETARKKAFSELASMESADSCKVNANQGNNLANSRKSKPNESMEGTRVKAQQDKYGDVSCDKCRPVAGGHTVVVPLTDSRDFSDMKRDQSSGGGGGSLKDKSNPFKGWFSRGKKKLNNASPASMTASKDQTSSSLKEHQSSSSHVCSSLINAEAEKELEMAMAMDLMELKVLQANTKRDAAMAEMLELRLAMESMGKKLAQVERHCMDVKSQLLDVRTMQEQGHDGGEDDDDDQDGASFEGCDERVVASMRGLSYGYMQPSKSEFFNAVAEARVGVKQLCRVLLQHIQDSKVSLERLEEGKEAKSKGNYENLAHIMVMIRDNNDNVKVKGGSLSSRGLRYHLEAVISMAFYEHFENVGFDKSGTHKVLDPTQRAMAFYHAFLKLAKLTCTQLLTQTSPLYNPAFDLFCARKMRSVGRAVGCAGRLWPDELARTFLAAARGVWLLHHLAFAFHVRPSPPGIFRVACDSPFDARFMELLPTDHRHVADAAHLVVTLMVMPGFFVADDVIKCKVLAT